MKTYRIIGRTNSYIAQRDSTFGGKTMIVIEKGLTLKEAQKKILDFFNEDYETYYKNWGLVRCNSDMAYSHSDGTRGYEYDSRYFEIEEVNMKRIEFFEPSDVEQFVDFAFENDLDYEVKENGLVWIVSEDVAKKIQDAHPYYDYWNIEDYE